MIKTAPTNIHVKRSTIMRSIKKNRPRAVRAAAPCMLCAEPMWVAPGQHALFHAACRTKGRSIASRMMRDARKA